MGLLQETQQDYYDGNDFGGYQFVSLDNIITNFTIAYVGENKIIPKIKRTDIAFHAQRAIQELSFDTFKSIKSQEITLPPSLTMKLPQDYVNYTKICWVDGNGIERPLYPTRHTSNPTPILQNEDGEYKITAVGTFTAASNSVVLNGEYPNITSGMLVDIPNPDVITGSVGVYRTTVENGITTIDLIKATGALAGFPANAGLSGDYTLNFTSNSTNINNLILEKDTSLHLENLSWDTNDHIITQSPNTDVSKVKVGMRVYGPTNLFGDEKVLVTSVNGAVITVSHPMLFPSTLLTNGSELKFMSTSGDSETWEKFQTVNDIDVDDALAYNHDTDIYDLNVGQRYGLEPEHAQTNGTYYIDELKGKIHFSSNVAEKTVILKYISDGLATDNEMIVHKFAEEAMYKSIAYAILSTSTFGQALVPRFKREKFAAIRTAKLRLSNIKIHELVQTMRNKSAWIKR